MKKYVLIILFLGFGIKLSQAQKRVGLELRAVPVSSVKSLYFYQDRYKAVNYPQVGCYFQRWLTDRRFAFQSITLQYYKMKDTGPLSDYRVESNLGVLHYSVGRGFYLNHREFEDNFATYISTSLGVAAYLYNQMEYEPGLTEPETSLSYWDGFASFELGFGIEKSINRKWLANVSVDGHMQMFEYNPFFVSLSLRLLYRRY